MIAKVNDDSEKKGLWWKRHLADALPSPTVLTLCRNTRKHLVATHGSLEHENKDGLNPAHL